MGGHFLTYRGTSSWWASLFHSMYHTDNCYYYLVVVKEQSIHEGTNIQIKRSIREPRSSVPAKDLHSHMFKFHVHRENEAACCQSTPLPTKGRPNCRCIAASCSPFSNEGRNEFPPVVLFDLPLLGWQLACVHTRKWEHYISGTLTLDMIMAPWAHWPSRRCNPTPHHLTLKLFSRKLKLSSFKLRRKESNSKQIIRFY